MPDDQEFQLPDVGEGLTEAVIVRWLVALGDAVEVNQIVVEIETAKSVVELPSPFAGTVAALLADAGETVEVGTPILRVSPGGQPAGSASAAEADGEQGEEPKLLVGYGAKEGRTRRRGQTPIHRDPTESPVSVQPAGRHEGLVPEFGPGSEQRTRPRAKPPVRALAKSLGVDLMGVTGSGPDGVIVREDVVAASAGPASGVGAGPATGTEQRLPIRGVRKQTALAMVRSAFTAPHVTEFVTVDMTRALRLGDALRADANPTAPRLNALVFVAYAYMWALRRTPIGHARWDEEAQEIVVPAEVNLGIAVSTPRGLVVPNIRNADSLRLGRLAEAISDVAGRARAGRVSLTEMQGGTTTITNVGVFGVDTGTPILNPGESSVLALGTVRRAPWVVMKRDKEKIKIRSVVQLAISFDHRVMDGREGSRILADTARALEEPAATLI